MARPRKPTQLHRLQGTFNVTDHRGRQDDHLGPPNFNSLPKTEAGMRRFLSRVPWLRNTDVVTLAEYARIWSHLVKSEPGTAEHSRMFACWSRIAKDMGLTALSREQLRATDTTPSRSALGDLLSKGKSA